MERLIEFRNERTGQRGVMSGSSVRFAVLQAYARYGLGDSDTVELEKAYGSLVVSTDEEARLQDWVARFLPV